MSAAAQILISRELEAIGTDFTSRRGIGPDELAETGEFLSKLAQLARHMEMELSIFRDMEAGREIRRTMETTATDHLVDLVADADGKVIRADFGGRS